jgi:ParB-like chromosome segregation protein Spo0J
MKKHKQLTVKIADLKGLEKNARVHSDLQIQQIMESLSRFGFLSPIVIDKNKEVFCGNGRIEAAKRLGLTEAPAILADSLTRDEMRAFALVDNRLGDNSSFDLGILKEELDDLMLNLDIDLGPVGFSPSEIEALLAGPILPVFEPDLGDDNGSDSDKKIKLTVEFSSMGEMDDLFAELKDRGFKVKAG